MLKAIHRTAKKKIKNEQKSATNLQNEEETVNTEIIESIRKIFTKSAKGLNKDTNKKQYFARIEIVNKY